MRSQMNTNSRYADTFSDSTGGIHNRTTHDTLSLNKPLGASIRNEIGEQNCYVNVIIHTIFNIKEMREYFLTEEIENEDRLSILFEMKMIIEKYHDLVSIACKTPETFKFIDPIDFRRELDNLFREEKKFRMKSMGDPVDLFFVILNSFHSYRSSSLKYIHETPCNPPCLAHSLFWINLLEQNECERCGATSEVLQYDYNYFIYEVYVKELLNKLEGRDDMSRNLVKLIKEVNSIPNINECPEKCQSERVHKNIFLLNSPPYFCFNLTWIKTNPSLVDIAKLFFMLPLKFNNDELFELSDKKITRSYELFGLVCYWGAHYICYFKSQQTKEESWICYDDLVITSIPNWKEVIIKNVKGHFHPTMLFYRTANEKRKDTGTNVLNDDDKKKILDYCSFIDKQSDWRYKNEEVDRIRPQSKRKSDPKFVEEIRSTKASRLNVKQENDKLLNDYNGEHLDEGNQQEIDSTRPLYKDMVTSQPTLLDLNQTLGNGAVSKEFSLSPHVKEDEWLCDVDFCNNINKNDDYKCLKCRRPNENIWDLNYQKKKMKEQEELRNSMMNRQTSQEPSRRSKELSQSTRIKTEIHGRDKDQLDSYLNKFRCHKCDYLNSYHKLRCGKCDNLLHSNGSGYDLKKNSNDYYYSKEKLNSPNEILNKTETFKSADETSSSSNTYSPLWICSFCKRTNLLTDNCKHCKRNQRTKPNEPVNSFKQSFKADKVQESIIKRTQPESSYKPTASKLTTNLSSFDKKSNVQLQRSSPRKQIQTRSSSTSKNPSSGLYSSMRLR